MKLIDGFVFYNELGLLKYRLDTLYEIVDNFILVESTKTFSGNSKELFYEKNKHLYEKYQVPPFCPHFPFQLFFCWSAIDQRKTRCL